MLPQLSLQKEKLFLCRSSSPTALQALLWEKLSVLPGVPSLLGPESTACRYAHSL
jgi:hypothetical protein